MKPRDVVLAVSNVLVKRVTGAEMLSLVAWLSLVPPLPSLALSLALDGPRPPSSSASASGSSGWPGWCW